MEQAGMAKTTTTAGRPLFRFLRAEVAEMEARLQQQVNRAIPDRSVIQALAEKFTASTERAGTVGVKPVQVWYWFLNRNRMYRSRNSRMAMLPIGTSHEHKLDSTTRAISSSSTQSTDSSSGKNHLEGGQIEYEAKSARDGSGFDILGLEPWMMNGSMSINVCANVLFQDLLNERKDHALYFDAQVIDAQKRRHDARGCRCRFLVRYDDQSEVTVPKPVISAEAY
uniref:SAWADEE domain-containing protein n=1 Tax=Leersia perrieri TaxID=77586 RepID=A0A0D9WQ40_9ORYZ